MGHKGKRKRHADVYGDRPRMMFPKQAPVSVQADDQAYLQALFHKSFTYSSDASDPWKLPSADTMFTSEPWAHVELQNLKGRLNAVKNKLSHLDIEKWHRHTAWTHRAGLVVSHLRQNVNPELCTQAWCKFLEILKTFNIMSALPRDPDNPVGSVHLCEAPGAFVTCLNHTLHMEDTEVQWQWIANTLNPFYEGNNISEMISDDRLIVHTTSKWCFGRDNTGNVMNGDNMDALKNCTTEWKAVHLVTADGSIDCANQPGRQEECVARLHLCEVTTALHVLSPGGILVLKTFTLLEASSVCLMYLLKCTFDRVSVFKPCTSKPGNSEVYVVCAGYTGLSDQILTALRKAMDAEQTRPMFSLAAIPLSFLSQHLDCCTKFCTWQIDTIEENLSLYTQNDTETKLRMESLRVHFLEMFMERFGVDRLDNALRIVPDIRHEGKKRKCQTLHYHTGHKRHTGTYVSRQQELQLSWQQRLAHYSKMDLRTERKHIIWLPSSLSDGPQGDTDCTWAVETGSRPSWIHSSLFCEQALLDAYSAFLHHSQYLSSTEAKSCHPDFKPGLENILSSLTSSHSSSKLQDVDHSGEPETRTRKQKLYVRKLGETEGHFSEVLKTAEHLEVQYEEAENKVTRSAIVNTQTVNDVDETNRHCAHRECPRVVVMETLVTGQTDMEQLLSPRPLNDLLTALEELRPGDHLVMCSVYMTTRLSAGVLYLLSRLFKQVGVCWCDSSPLLYLTALHHTPPSPALSQHLYQCQALLEVEFRGQGVELRGQGADPTSALLSPIPTQLLLGVPFYDSLRAINDIILKQRLQFLLHNEMAAQGRPDVHSRNAS